MLFDELAQTTIALKNLQHKTEIKKNKEQQDNTDNRYRVLVSQLDKLSNTLKYIYDNIGVHFSLDIIKKMDSIMEILQNTVEGGWAISEDVINAETLFKSLQSDIKKEWNSKYIDTTGATINTLEAIKDIDADNVNLCLHKIKSAANWELGETNFKLLKAGMESAEALITELSLDDDIILFLRKTNSNRATLKDLNEKVLNWITKEDLGNKIRISFVK